jgi:hypothetical protein
MSRVTNFILVTGLDDGMSSDEDETPNADKMNELLEARYPDDQYLWARGKFNRVDGEVVGPKAMEMNVFIAALNLVDTEEIAGFLNEIPWEHPEAVELFVREEDSDVCLRFVPGWKPDSD